jgi:hypothetical protein
MKQRKGMETVVAWVLLLGFSITLGVFVFMWATKSTTSMTESTIKSIEGGMQCDNVQLYAVFNEDPPGSGDFCKNITITNNGYFTVSQIIVRGTTATKTIPKQDITDVNFVPLKPRGQINGWTVGWDWGGTRPTTGATLELIPVIIEKDSKITCPDKLIRIQC